MRRRVVVQMAREVGLVGVVDSLGMSCSRRVVWTTLQMSRTCLLRMVCPGLMVTDREGGGFW